MRTDKYPGSRPLPPITAVPSGPSACTERVGIWGGYYPVGTSQTGQKVRSARKTYTKRFSSQALARPCADEYAVWRYLIPHIVGKKTTTRHDNCDTRVAHASGTRGIVDRDIYSDHLQNRRLTNGIDGDASGRR